MRKPLMQTGDEAHRKLQETLYEEIIGRIKQDDSSVPVTVNGYTTTLDLNKDKTILIIVGKPSRTARKK